MLIERHKIKSNFYKDYAAFSQSLTLQGQKSSIHHLKVSPTINKDVYRIKLNLPVFKKVSIYNNFIYNIIALHVNM